MICLTGDLHHTSLGTGNQAACDITEIQVAVRFLELLERRNIKVTFFISGRSFAQEGQDLLPIVESSLVEIGGHNYSCFQPALPYRIYKKLTGSYHGPAWVQRTDVKMTIRQIQRSTGTRIRCWRNHMYMHDANTEKVLNECGISAISDGVKRDTAPQFHRSGILEVPINIIPDHEHLYHAERTPSWVQQWQQRYGWSDDYGPESYYIGEWTDLVLEGLRENESRGVPSTLIIHPITMYLCDGMKEVERILDYIAECDSVYMSELVTRMADPS